jgi:hypothetical protein
MPKKVVLFIVEGPSDELSLSTGLKKSIQNELVKFKVIHGDITSDAQTTTSNVKSKIREKVIDFLNQNSYNPSDILEIIHLVDTDGSYIPNHFVLLNPNAEHYTYHTSYIEYTDISKVIQRNQRKNNNMNVLIHQEFVTINRRQVPYKIYYMSCNLDHVLHHSLNLSDDEKIDKAFEFSRNCIDNENLFIDTLSNCLPLSCDYFESWEFIKIGTNSLNRYNNFQLYLTSKIV